MKSLSYSKIDTYKTCPYRFRRVYIDKDVDVPPGYALRYGNFLHGVLEDFGNYLKDSDSKFPPDINDKVKTSWIKQASTYHITDKADLDQSRAIIHQYSSIMRSYGLFEIVDNERSFKIKISDFTIKDKIDQILKLGDKYVIRDYKTNKDDKYLVADPLQLKIYALAGIKELNAEPEDIVCSYMFLKLGCKDVPMSSTKDVLESTEVYVEALGRSIEDNEKTGDFRANVGPLCPWCPAITTCKFAQRDGRLMMKYSTLKAQGKVA